MYTTFILITRSITTTKARMGLTCLTLTLSVPHLGMGFFSVRSIAFKFMTEAVAKEASSGPSQPKLLALPLL